MNYVEQGDVLLFMEDIPSDLVDTKTHIVQFGEHTGHAHRLEESETVWECPKTKTRYLKLVKPTMLRHEEHNPIELAPGTYRIGIVREYDPFEDEIRSVRD